MTSSRESTPQERLAASRKAIIRHMTADDETYVRQSYETGSAKTLDEGTSKHGNSAWQSIRRATRAWWHHHPAHLAVDLARPVVGKYAEEKPFQLLAIAAGVGAAVVLVRPWRLVSITGLAVTALKSSELSGFLLSLLSTHRGFPNHENHN